MTKTTSVFPLWMFEDSSQSIITRGRTQEEAYRHAAKSWERGQTICFSTLLPIWAGKAYDSNHSPGWLYRSPEWLRKEETGK